MENFKAQICKTILILSIVIAPALSDLWDDAEDHEYFGLEEYVVCRTDEHCHAEGVRCDMNNEVPGVHELYFCEEPICDRDEIYRSFDGSCNNLVPERTTWGSTGKIQNRLIAPRSDPFNGPPVREVSDAIFKQDEPVPNSYGMSALLIHFGQFVGHDLDLTAFIASGEFNLGLEDNMPNIEIEGSGQLDNFDFTRTQRFLGVNGTDFPWFPNALSTYMDLSMVYGSRKDVSDQLRSFDGGLLKFQLIDGEEYPPFQSDLPGVPVNQEGNIPKLFAFGDVRGNENIALTSLHIIWNREHNRLARALDQQENGRKNDEWLYQEARRWNIAQWQSILMFEYLPCLIGETIPDFRSYDDDLLPEKHLLFSTAAYRVGHSGLPETFRIVDDRDNAKELPMREAFFTPQVVIDEKPGSIIKGIQQQCHEELDTKLVESIRTFLFEGLPPTGAGLDLGSMDIMRGRDHELGLYTKYREYYNLSVPRTFLDVTGGDRDMADELDRLYRGDVSRCDPFVCGLAEPAQNGQVGELFEAVFVDMFKTCRDGDRFYFENRDSPHPFSDHEIDLIKQITFADIVRRNTFLDASSGSNLIREAFFTGTCGDQECTAERAQQTNDDECCSSERPCGVGQGDCDNDSECLPGLECGSDNCRDFDADWPFSTWDCCEGEEVECDADFAQVSESGSDECCTNQNPCDIGQGDCDSNGECKPGLVCGVDNCRDFDRDWPYSTWDCCEEESSGTAPSPSPSPPAPPSSTSSPA